MIKNDIERILISEQQLSDIIDRLAQQITNDYKDSKRKLVFVVILKGSIPFATELMKRVTLPLEIEVMKVSSYGAGTKTSGEIRIHTDLIRDDLPDCDLLIIEDIVDSGRTLQRLTQLFSNRLADTNMLQIFVYGNEDHILLTSRLDNLGKGASGAAVQCMNIMMGIDERTGLV